MNDTDLRMIEKILDIFGYELKKKEGVSVTYVDWEYSDSKMEVNFSFKINDWPRVGDKDDVGDFLAQKLESYLNDK